MRIERELRGDAGTDQREARRLDEEHAAHRERQLTQRQRTGLDRLERERQRDGEQQAEGGQQDAALTDVRVSLRLLRQNDSPRSGGQDPPVRYLATAVRKGRQSTTDGSHQ